MDKYFYPSVSEETFAAWLDGTLSAEDERLFLEASAGNTELQELLDANDQIDESFENIIENGYELPDEFETEFDLPEIHASSADVEEYVYDDPEPYDADDNGSDDPDTNDDAAGCHEAAEAGDDYGQNDYEIL